MLKGHDDEIGFIGLFLIIYYLVYGWDATLQIILVVGGLIAILIIANLLFDLVDKIKEDRGKGKQKKGTK